MATRPAQLFMLGTPKAPADRLAWHQQRLAEISGEDGNWKSLGSAQYHRDCIRHLGGGLDAITLGVIDDRTLEKKGEANLLRLVQKVEEKEKK